MSSDPVSPDFDVPLRLLTEEMVEEDCRAAGCVGPMAHKYKIPVYRTADGTAVELQPGDCFFHHAHDPNEADGACHWTNCDGMHLFVVVPAKDTWAEGRRWLWHQWNVDGRASNCGSPNDSTHRCWCRSGDPAVPGSLHVAKSPGPTCSAGAGSFGHKNWHGFLHRGRLSVRG